MFKSIPLGSQIPLVYNIKPLCLLVLLVYNINNRSMSSTIKCHILTNIVSIWKSPMANHGHSWSNVALWQKLYLCLNQHPRLYQFLLVYSLLGNGCTLDSPIPLVYNIKPLGLLFLWVSTWKSPMANHGHSWSNIALWQQLSQCLKQFPWIHQFLLVYNIKL